MTSTLSATDDAALWLSGLEPLPERSRLLHIGMMKSGTTSIQRAASGHRAELLVRGVRYPGRHYNHRQASLALMRRTSDRRPPQAASTTGDQQRALDAWDALISEVDADTTRRILISNEFISGWDVEIARRFLDELGERTHVVVTMRSYAAVLPSVWQQCVKTGYPDDLEAFLRRALADPPDLSRLPPGFARHDQAATVRRWVAAAGAERLTVVVGRKPQPLLVQRAFERLLALPAGALEAEVQSGFDRNRSLSAEEAALLLRINQLIEPCTDAETPRIRSLRNRLAVILQDRPPSPTDSILTLPGWADERATAVGRTAAAQIRELGVRVVGDLDELAAPAPQAGQGTVPDRVPTELAAQAAAFALSAALGREARLPDAKKPEADRPDRDGRRDARTGPVVDRLLRSLRRHRHRRQH